MARKDSDKAKKANNHDDRVDEVEVEEVEIEEVEESDSADQAKDVEEVAGDDQPEEIQEAAAEAEEVEAVAEDDSEAEAVAEEEAEAAEDQADEVQEAEEDAEEAAEDKDDAKEEDGSGEDDDAPPKKTRTKGPRPKVTILTMILIVLNTAAALGFVFLMSLNFQKRQMWAFATFQRDLDIQGLPLEQEDDGESGSRATLPRVSVTGEALKAAFAKRGGPLTRVTEGFKDIDEKTKHTIEPSYLTPEIAKAHFGDLGDPVTTLEAEIRRQKTAFPEAVAKVASEEVEKVKALAGDAKQREAVRRAILPVALSVHQIRDLNARINAASGEKLLTLLDEGVQRRMLVEALAPLEVLRPGALDKKDEKFLLTSAGELAAYPLDELKALFAKRMDAAIADKFDAETMFGDTFAGKPRGSIEKRDAIGLALLALANVHKPDGTFLDERGLDRAKKVLGFWEFLSSARNYIFCLSLLFDEVIMVPGDDGRPVPVSVGLLATVHEAREGHAFAEAAKTKRVLPASSFAAQYDEWVQNIRDLQRELHVARKRFEELQAQNKLAEATYMERVKHLDETIAKLNAARAHTLELVNRARAFQDEIFKAQAELVDASEANYRLEAEIRREQLRLKGKTP